MRLTRCTVINSVGYRGDTRPPEEIFPNGFSNRQTPEYQWLQVLAGGSDDVPIDLDIRNVDMDHLSHEQQQVLENLKIPKACDPLIPGKLTYRLWVKNNPRIYATFTLGSVAGISGALWEHYIQNLPLYREDKDDISPKTAVCFTLRGPHVAPYFPIDGCMNPGGEWIWLYAVILGAAYKTYRVQAQRGSSLANAQEVAVEHIASNHVLCAVRCWRKGKYPTMKFLLAPRICWNPRAGGERMLWRDEILTALYPYQSYEATCHACNVVARSRNPTRVFLEPPYPYWRWQR